MSQCTVCIYCICPHTLYRLTLHDTLQRILDIECTGGFHLVKKKSSQIGVPALCHLFVNHDVKNLL